MFAACPPYSYSYLNKRVSDWCNPTSANHIYSSSNLVKSVCGLDVPLLTVSSKHQNEKKKYVVVMARSHPGESAGSWVVDGLLDWLASTEHKLHSLLNKITMKVIPMMNPDGVFLGNYRTGVTGKDFNRCFYSGRPALFPEIAALRNLVS